MHIRKRIALAAAAVAAVGLGVGAIPALATQAGHARAADADPVTPPLHAVLIDVFSAKEHVPVPNGGASTTTMVPSRWGIDLGATNTVTVYNYTASAHTIVAPDLHLNVAIKPGKTIRKRFAGETATERVNGVVPSVTRFTVTGETQGAYAWQSTVPADAGKWGMSGYIVVN